MKPENLKVTGIEYLRGRFVVKKEPSSKTTSIVIPGSALKCRTLNLNTLAKQITEREGLKVSLSVAQAKECLRHTLDLLSEESDATVLKLLQRRRNRGEA